MRIGSRVRWTTVALALMACTTKPGTQQAPTLDDYKAKMRDVLRIPRVAFLDADESCNCIVVGITDPSAAAAVQTYATNAGVPGVTTVATTRFLRRWSLL